QGTDMTAKETVRALLDRLPDDCSLDDVLYHLYVVQAVGEGLADSNAGRVIPHDEVAAELRRKWLLGSAEESGLSPPAPHSTTSSRTSGRTRGKRPWLLEAAMEAAASL